MEARRIENEKEYYAPIDIIRFMLHGALLEGDPARWTLEQRKQQKQREQARQTGVIHATYSKDQLIKGRSIAVNSFWTLERQINGFSHFTPQIYLWGKQNNAGRHFGNLRFITCIGVEIDQRIQPEEIHYTAAMLGLSSPNLILSTPRGVQWFYVLSSPFAGSRKARNAGKFVAETVKQAFVEKIGADPGANPLGYFRFPKDENIEFFQASPVNTEWLLTWAKKRSKEQKRAATVRKEQSYVVGQGGIMDDPAIQAILHNVFIKGSKGKLGRNNAIFTLSLALKYEGKSEQDIYDQMDEWNSRLISPVTDREVRKIVHSAMKDDYRAPQKEYVEALAGIKAKYNLHIRTPRKPREERVRSHYSEREQDIIDYLESHCTASEPYVQGSIRSLAKTFGMAKETLMDVLKRTKRIIKKTYGRGCSARTFLTCRSLLLKSHSHEMRDFLLGRGPFPFLHDHQKKLRQTPFIGLFQMIKQEDQSPDPGG